MRVLLDTRCWLWMASSPDRLSTRARTIVETIDNELLPIEHAHALHVATLPLHHRDPFDRMLVAQAQCEAMTLASRDPHIRRYDVALLPV